MSYAARVRGMERAVGYRRARGSTWGRMLKEGATAYYCDDCGRDYLILPPLEPEHDAYSQCGRCMSPERALRETDLMLQRLLGMSDDE